MWKEAEKFLLKEKYIGPLVMKYGPCKIRKRPKKYYFEDLVDSIVQQQLSIKAAAIIFNRIKEKTAESKKNSLKKHRWRAESTLSVILTPENVLALSDKQLRSCGLSRSKVSYIKNLADRVVNNKLNITRLDKLSDEEVMSELVSVKGIGRWTAEMFLMFSLARPDIFPVDDLGIRNGIRKLVGKNMSSEKMIGFARRWKPYRTAASWYIWASLDNK